MSSKMFGEHQEFRDWNKLMDAIDEVGETACMNYPDAWFPDREEKNTMWNEAKEFCNACPVMRECAAYGVRWATHGIWGGLSDRQRVNMRTKLGIVL